ncbi:hypothetical protein Dimus_034758 [Dionaea muscipula]
MGCVSSKLFKQDLKQELLLTNGEYRNHIVSLTSSTLGVLKLENSSQELGRKQTEEAEKVVVDKRSKTSPPREEPEVIDAVQLMGDLEEGLPSSIKAKKSPKSLSFFAGYAENAVKRSPLKFLNQVGSPKWVKKIGGKENKAGQIGAADSTPKSVLKSWSTSGRLLSNSKGGSRKSMPLESKFFDSPRNSLDDLSSRRRRSLTPLFDPQLLESYEKELSLSLSLSGQREDIKQMVFSKESNAILEKFEVKCPPGGENAVVIYTTTLRGIRKTFEDCNAVRSTVESHQVHVLERDVSMHSGFKEELRKLMGRKEVKVPVVFVKGRLIGGVDQVVSLEEEGKLGILLDGINKANACVCVGCGGIRFVMCLDCNGSCKVFDEMGKNMVRCAECNENGLIHCPICS